MNQPGGRIKAPMTRRGRLSARAVRKSMRASSQASVGPGMRLSHDYRGGIKLSAAARSAPLLPFRVTMSAGNIVVRAGRHYWYDTTNEDYTATTLDSTSGAWASVAVPTAGTSKYVYFTRAHDSGAVTTATVAKGVATTEAAATALANDYTKVWIIAVLTADADGVVTIEQRLTQDVEDGPDCRTKGMIKLWNSATLPRGWAWHTALQERFPVGYKSGSSDYGTMGATGGYAVHGESGNNHLPHLINHFHEIETDTVSIVTESTCVLVENDLVKQEITFVDNVLPSSKCGAMSDYWCDDVTGPPLLRMAETAGGNRLMFEHSNTDNRPPYSVVGFIIKL